MAESPAEKIPYERRFLEKGKHYAKDGDFLIPCQTPVHPFDLPADQQALTVLDKQMARIVVEWDRSWVIKSGFGIRPPEAEAMKLVFQHTKVPVPEVLWSNFPPDQELEPPPSETSRPDDRNPEGLISMTIIPGVCLEQKWDTLDDIAKESVCRQLWDFISELRTIPRPLEAEGLYQCLADGSPSRDPMFEDLQTPARPLLNDEELRARIYERYLHCGGSRYENELPDMLPRSECSVFTHADIAPRNIMVDEQNQITGILDWEWAGWYPDYWEYAQILRPAFWGDWSIWMEKTAPQRWDLKGINASRKVLF